MAARGGKRAVIWWYWLMEPLSRNDYVFWLEVLLRDWMAPKKAAPMIPARNAGEAGRNPWTGVPAVHSAPPLARPAESERTPSLRLSRRCRTCPECSSSSDYIHELVRDAGVDLDAHDVWRLGNAVRRTYRRSGVGNRWCENACVENVLCFRVTPLNIVPSPA